MESANNALSKRVEKPAFSYIRFSSSAVKIPDALPVPMKVPIVSKVSDKLKVKIVDNC